MSTYASGAKLAELRLIDVPADGSDGAAAPAEQPAQPPPSALPEAPAPSGDAVRRPDIDRASSPAPRDVPAPGADTFLAEATRELEAGRIEQPLWVRAMAEARGDATLATPAYLRLRAAALRVEKRDRRAQRSARPRASSSPKPEAGDPRSSDRFPWVANSRRMTIAGGVLGALIVVAAWVALRSTSDTAAQPDVVRAGSSAGTAVAARSTKAAAAAAPVRQEMSSDDFGGKVRELEEAGNWNVVVLYAAEWTRKQPANPQAWKELGRGYLRLRQYNDALDAVTKAVQLAPTDSQLWQDLGQVSASLGDPASALVAYGRATALNERDVTSLVNIGMLHAQLGHLPEARIAFANALAVSPADTEALCGAEAVARKEGRPKDADALRRSLTADGRACRDWNASEGVTVAAGAAVKKKPSAPSPYQ